MHLWKECKEKENEWKGRRRGRKTDRPVERIYGRGVIYEGKGRRKRERRMTDVPVEENEGKGVEGTKEGREKYDCGRERKRIRMVEEV